MFHSEGPKDGSAVACPPPATTAAGINRKASQSSIRSTTSQRSILSTADPGDIVRPEWGNQVEFLLTCIAMAVGLGNVWRFPYLCFQHGGGTFLLPYVIMLFVIGIPIFFLEISMGQFASLGPLVIWYINPFFKGVGYSMVTVNWIIGLYYNVVIAQCLLFLVMSFRSVLPWTTCDNSWNSANCTFDVAPGQIENVTNIGRADWFNVTGKVDTEPPFTDGISGSSAEEFYYNFVLGQSSTGIAELGSPQLPLLCCFAACWLLVCLGLLKGAQSLGKISYFTATFPYFMLTALLIRGLTLPGSELGVARYVTPDWSKLADPDVWQKAATQIFYNLSASTGGLIAMASFNNFKHNSLRDSIFIPILNIATSVFAGFVVFCVIGFMAHSKNIPVDELGVGGPGLVFIVYPEALAKMPLAPLWSVMFFIMMLSLGFGSQLSIVEGVLTAIQEDMNVYLGTSRRKILYRIVMCIISFLLGLPMICNGGSNLLALVDSFISSFPLLIIAFLELMCVAHIYGYARFARDVNMMLGREPGIYFKIMWKYVTPAVLAVLIVGSAIGFVTPVQTVAPRAEGVLDELPYPDWALALGWVIAIGPMVIIPAWMMYYHCYLDGWDLIKDHNMSLPNWGPRNVADRIGDYTPALFDPEEYFPDDVEDPDDAGLVMMPASNSATPLVDANNSERETPSRRDIRTAKLRYWSGDLEKSI